MSALIRYYAALLLGSQRWVGPVALFGFIVLAGLADGQPLGGSLAWCAAALVPSSAALARGLLGAESADGRAVLCAAAGPRRVHIAGLIVALTSGLFLAVVGGVIETVASYRPTGGSSFSQVLTDGAAAELTAVLIGSAVGALCAPPLVRRPAAGLIGVLVLGVAAVVAPVSPANAAMRGVSGGWSPDPVTRFPLVPLPISVVVVAAAWLFTARNAARNPGR